MEDFSGNNSSSEQTSPVKNVEFGLGGILLGLFFVAVVFLALNYFNIISLPFLPKASNPVPTQPKQLTIEQKAKKAGFSVIWQGNTEDGTGRTILASSERKYGNYPDAFGWRNTNIYGKEDFGREVGIFKRWEKIPKSKDKYLILENPERKLESPVRILEEVSELSSVYGEEKKSDVNRTKLEVEDLNVNGKDLSKTFKIIDFFYNLNQKTIDKIIKPGDVISVFSIPFTREEVKDRLIKEDPQNIPAVASVVIRRFGGLSQIKKELNEK